MSQRSTALDALKTIIDAVSAINTVLLETEKPTIDMYASSQLPLVVIYVKAEYEDTPMHGGFTLWRCNPEVILYWLSDSDDDDTKESLIKGLKDALGGDITLNGTCAECKITGIRDGGRWPLWETSVALNIDYEKAISNA